MTSDQAQTWVLSSSPHAHSGDSVQKIMLAVIVALVPCMVAAVVFFGLNAAALILSCVATCVIAEAAGRRLMRRDAGITDLSAVVTGILLALNLPPGLPCWMAVIGSLFAILVAKQAFGGIGYNPFNPALAGRAMLMLSFPVAMTTWFAPAAGSICTDAVTTATPLGAFKLAGTMPEGFLEKYSVLSLLVGNRPGCIGETSAIAILAGGALLMWRRCISWHTPVAFVGTVAIFSGLVYAMDPEHNLTPLYHVLSGGLLLGAIFMATDMVTTPVTRAGMLVFGVGCGVLTFLFRKWGGMPEGVSFAILIMNGLTPLINKMTRPRPFGHGPAKA